VEKYTFEDNNKVGCGSPTDTGNVPLVPSQSALLSRSGSKNGLVPVVEYNNNPLFPCAPSVARKLIKVRKATPFYKKGFFAIRLNKVIDNTSQKRIVIAIDPGSKRTGITVATEENVVLNIQCNTPDWVKEKMEVRKAYRKNRRNRKTPYRKCKYNRKMGGISPSTKARWNAHIRIIDQLCKILPITDCVIEDIKAVSWKNAKKWNCSFGPLEVGKTWFENKIRERGFNLYKKQGFETKKQRDFRGFRKTTRKLENIWEAHCVDSHCLAEIVYNELFPVKQIHKLTFMYFIRRELHQGFLVNGIKKNFGSTRSMGLNRGCLVKHYKHGLTFVGGSSKNRLSLYNFDRVRLCQNAKKNDCKVLTKRSWVVCFSKN